MKKVKIKESGAEIIVEKENCEGCSYRSIISDRLYKEEEVEVIEDIPYRNWDNPWDEEIDILQEEIRKRKERISMTEKGLEWLAKYRDDLDAPESMIAFSFLNGFCFYLDKSKCCAILNDIKYENECLLALAEKHLNEYKFKMLSSSKKQNDIKPMCLGGF